MHVSFGISKKALLRLMNKHDSLKHVQNFDAHNSIKKKGKEKKKEENIQFIAFRNTCNITKTFQLAQGKFTEIGDDCNKKILLAVLCHDCNT